MKELRFKVGDRVILSDNCREEWCYQNKNKFGDVFGGLIIGVTIPNLHDADFDYRVQWDKGASSDICWYSDKDLELEKQIYNNNKMAVNLLSKEW